MHNLQKEKVGKLNFIKIKNFCLWETVNGEKRQAADWFYI